MITDAQYYEVSQNAHILAGALAVLAPIALGATNPWYGAGAIMIFAAIKEFWYDEKDESPEVRGSSTEDFIFYGVGTLTGLAAHFIHTSGSTGAL